MKKVFIVFLITLVLLSFSSCTTNQIEKFLETIEHNKNIVFSDDHYVYFYNNKIEHDVEMLVEYVTNQEIYYSALENNKVIITKYDIASKDTTELFSFVGERTSINFYEQWIEYSTVNGTKLFSLSENQEYDYSDNLLQKESSNYTIYSDGYIKNNSTNTVKKVELNDESNIFNTVQAKELKRLGAGFTLEIIKIHKDKIYVVVGNEYFIDTVYLYDFETEQFTFLDWNKNTNGNVNLFVLE